MELLLTITLDRWLYLLKNQERMGCNVIIVESDSMEPVEACSGRDVWMTEPAAIYADCVDLVSV
jgi:hypothetical protein